MAFVCLSGIVLLGIIGLMFLKLNMKEKLDINQFINLILTSVLVVTTIVYAYLTYSSVKVSKEMAKQMHLSNQINYRPYILIEELPVEQLTARKIKSNALSGIGKESSPIFAPGFATLMDPNTKEESILCNVSNVGNVPAHNIKYNCYIYEVEEKTGNIKELSTPNETISTSECLFPGRSFVKMFKVGKNVFYRSDTIGKYIRISLKVTYEGVKNIDTNKYFTSCQLRCSPAESVEEMNTRGPGNLFIEMSDEGIEK